MLWGVKEVSSSESWYACWCPLAVCSIDSFWTPEEWIDVQQLLLTVLFCFVSDLRLRNLLLLTAMSHHLRNNSATLCTMRYYDLFFFTLLTCWDIRLFFCRKIAFQIKPSRAFEIPLSTPGWSKRTATRYSLWENILLFHISLF